MRFRPVLITLVVAVCSAWSCRTDGNNKNANNRLADNRNTLAKTSGNTAGNVSVPPPGNVNTVVPARNRLPKNMPEHHEPPQPLQFREAPEDSQIATTMNREGHVVETRIFKSHPQLVRVEATWLDAKVRLLKITLKSGKVIELKTDRVVSLQAASASLLVDLAKQAK